MESITIKVDDDLAREIDLAMKPYYSTKTEFIREAIRDKIKMIRKDEAIDKLNSFFGKSKVKTSKSEERNIRDQVSKRFAKDFGIELE
ncbi:MAG: ribbon-helix-helix domain-containing protein [Nanoarchaeota archaeon]